MHQKLPVSPRERGHSLLLDDDGTHGVCAAAATTVGACVVDVKLVEGVDCTGVVLGG